METRRELIEKFFSNPREGVETDVETKKDWSRLVVEYSYFNGENASIEEGREEDVIPANLKNTDPRIIEYIKKYGHQNGFLNNSMTETWLFLGRKGIHTDIQRRRFDFIENNDGSVTYTERFYIDSYRKMSNPEDDIKASEQGRPIAVGITQSKIYLDGGRVQHTLTSDRILLFDAAGEELFDEDGVEKKYNIRTEDIEEELKKQPNAFFKAIANFAKQHPILFGIGIGIGATLIAAGIVAAIVFSGGAAALPIAGAVTWASATVGASIGSAITAVFGTTISATVASVIGASVIGVGLAAAATVIGTGVVLVGKAIRAVDNWFGGLFRKSKKDHEEPAPSPPASPASFIDSPSLSPTSLNKSSQTIQQTLKSDGLAPPSSERLPPVLQKPTKPLEDPTEPSALDVKNSPIVKKR